MGKKLNYLTLIVAQCEIGPAAIASGGGGMGNAPNLLGRRACDHLFHPSVSFSLSLSLSGQWGFLDAILLPRGHPDPDSRSKLQNKNPDLNRPWDS